MIYTYVWYMSWLNCRSDTLVRRRSYRSSGKQAPIVTNTTLTVCRLFGTCVSWVYEVQMCVKMVICYWKTWNSETVWSQLTLSWMAFGHNCCSVSFKTLFSANRHVETLICRMPDVVSYFFLSCLNFAVLKVSAAAATVAVVQIILLSQFTAGCFRVLALDSRHILCGFPTTRSLF